MHFFKLLRKAGMLLLILNLNTIIIQAQQAPAITPLTVGKACPSFEFNTVRYAGKHRLTNKDFTGKYLIMDFWTTTCISCVESFPKISELQQEFKGKMDFLMVGMDRPGVKDYTKIETMYNKYRDRYHLDLSMVFDSAIFTQFDIPSVPHLIWILPDGTIKTITSSTDLKKENIDEFINNQPISLRDISKEEDKTENSFDYKKQLLINGNGGPDSVYLFRSILSKWDSTTNVSKVWRTGYNARFQVLGLPLKLLYYYAYFGTDVPMYAINEDTLYTEVSNQLVLETKDSGLFVTDRSSKNRFNCAIEIPGRKASRLIVMNQLQNLLQNYFGLYAKVVTRKMPCWKLMSLPGTRIKLRTKSKTKALYALGDEYKTFSPAQIEFENRPIHLLLTALYAFNPYEPPFLNETGIDYSIDLNLEAIMTDLEDTRRELHKLGLDLVKSTTPLRTIVISDHP
jgi:thiol-disulfide isomerase/thioredoxin